MKEYELTVLIHPDLEADLDTPLAKVRDIITNAGGKITREDNWGKKKLAYRIDKTILPYMCTSMYSSQLKHRSRSAIRSILPMKSFVTYWLPLTKKDGKL